jgi:hypothetical protein
MTPDQARGISSVLLSSGSIALIRCPTTSYVQITWSGSQRQAAYFEEKVNEIRRFFPTKAGILTTPKRTRHGVKLYPGLRFKLSSDKLRPIYNLFVPRGHKRISSSCLELCGARAAAWLISDHGHRTPNGLEIRSAAHHVEEYLLLAQWLQTLLGVVCKIAHRRDRPFLFIESNDAAKAAETLLDYAPATRRFLFVQLINDRDPVCQPCDRLLLDDPRRPQPEGSSQEALAGAAST